MAISIWIFIEAYRRLDDPPEILGGWMLVVALGGLAVNSAGAIILMRSERDAIGDVTRLSGRERAHNHS